MAMYFDIATPDGPTGIAHIYDPWKFKNQCQQLGIPFPQYGNVNQYRNPLGPGPGGGEVLMLRRDWDIAKSVDEGTLVIQSDGLAPLRFLKISVDTATCLTPGALDDPDAMFLVRLTDRRARLAKIPLDRGYNLRDGDGEYCVSSLATVDAGSGSGSGSDDDSAPWTWQAMVHDIWDVILAAYPDLLTLPNGVTGSDPPDSMFSALLMDIDSGGTTLTPHGVPEGFDFNGQFAWDAINVVLSRLGCALRYNNLAGYPNSDTAKDYFDIVRIGAAVPNADLSTIEPNDADILWSGDPQLKRHQKIPGRVQVQFRSIPCCACTGISYGVPVDIPAEYETTNDYDASATAIVWDDLYAIYTDGVLTNAATLAARAQERAADYYRSLVTGEIDWARQLLLSGAITGRPNARVKEVIWSHRGGFRNGGITTAIRSSPELLPTYGPWMDWFQMPRQSPCDSCGAASEDGSGGSGDGTTAYNYECRDGVVYVTRA